MWPLRIAISSIPITQGTGPAGSRALGLHVLHLKRLDGVAIDRQFLRLRQTVLLGVGLQTTPWLNEFWFLGLQSAARMMSAASPWNILTARTAALPRAPFGLTCWISALSALKGRYDSSLF